jgi:anti-sigma regulatory factor (Ser/Thr protein kinase)
VSLNSPRSVTPDLQFLDGIRQVLQALGGGLRLTLNGPEYEYLVETDRRELCVAICDTDAGHRLCELDRDACLSAACSSRGSEPVARLCPFYMLNVIAPVWVDGERIGFVGSSATFPERLGALRFERLVRRLVQLGLAPAHARRLVSRVPVVNESTVRRVLDIAQLCMGQAYRRSITRPAPSRGRVVAQGTVEARAKLDLEQARSEIELRSLVEQVNPHFLFNALSLISSFAVRGDCERIQSTIKTLAELLRYGLSAEEQLVPLADEIKHVTNYVRIQQQRFPGRIEAKISVQEEALRALVPRISLQPLVENCFRHGFEPSQNQFEVRLSAELRDGDLEMKIADNGAGMSAGKIKRVLRQSLARLGEPVAGIGIANVQRRLRHYFGDAGVLQIESIQRQGTTVTIHVPLRTQYCS